MIFKTKDTKAFKATGGGGDVILTVRLVFM